jgi:hypothetical protein
VIQPATQFNLVTKPDRRQNPDRRSAWRGSRRSADIREFGGPQPVGSVSPVGIDAAAEWSAEPDASHEDGLEVEGTKYIH